MIHAFKPQPDGTTRDLHTEQDDYRVLPDEVVRAGVQPVDKRDTWTPEARARLIEVEKALEPVTRAEFDLLKARLDKLEGVIV